MSHKLIWIICFSVQNYKKSQSCLYCFIKINITISKSRVFIFFEESLHLGCHHSGAYQKGSFKVFKFLILAAFAANQKFWLRTCFWKCPLLWNPSWVGPFFVFPLAKNKMITDYLGLEMSSGTIRFVSYKFYSIVFWFKVIVIRRTVIVILNVLWCKYKHINKCI